MARERDYKKEYQQRIAKAAREGRSRQSARGHRSAEYESQQRKTRAERPANSLRYWEARTRFGIAPAEYRVIVDSAVARSKSENPEAEVADVLRRKYQSAKDFMRRVDNMGDDAGYVKGSEAANSPAANGSEGQGRYYAFQKRYAFLPVELFWYHGYY